MSNWIKCSERFPSKPEQVLCCYIRPIFGVPSKRYETMYFDQDDGWRYWSNNKPVGYPVTHWQQLPDAPGDEE